MSPSPVAPPAAVRAARSHGYGGLGALVAEALVPLGRELGGDRDRIVELIAHLPHDAAAYFGCEVRLDDSGAPPEFAYSLGNGELRRLARGDDGVPDGIAEFARRWGESGDPPFGNGNMVWTEYELQAAQPGRRRGVFFALPRDCTGREAASPGGLRWACHALVPPLAGQPLPEPVEEAVLRVVESAPEEVRRVQVGIGLGHGAAALRVCLLSLPAHEVVPFLEACGWPGRAHAVAHLLERYGPCADRVGVDLDVGHEVLPTIGLELLYEGSDPVEWQPPEEIRWLALFDRLLEDGLCTDERRDALLAWPGRMPYGDPLVERLLSAVAGCDGPVGGTLVRGLQHVKLSLRGTEVRAKCYFGARLEDSAA